MEAFPEALDLMSDGLSHPHLRHQLNVLLLQCKINVSEFIYMQFEHLTHSVVLITLHTL